MPKLPVLTTERLVLRPFLLNDAKRVQELAGTKEVAATTVNIPHPYQDGMAEEWIGGQQESFNNDKSCTLAICLKDDSVLIGAIGLIISRADQRGSLGYWIGKEYWSKGYCTEAAQAIIEYGFEQLDLNRIFATHLEQNPASGKVMQKLGMKQEGVLRQHTKKWGEYHNLVYYGILKHEYSSF